MLHEWVDVTPLVYYDGLTGYFMVTLPLLAVPHANLSG